jgi:diguanylate cyclase (GGDEF)-like protein
MFRWFCDLRVRKLNALALAGRPVSFGKNLSLDYYARAGAVAVGVFGAVVASGWFFHIEPLKSVLPGLDELKVNAACCFAAAGGALWLLQTAKPGSQWCQLARVLAVCVAMLGAVALAERLSGIRVDVDQLFFPARAAVTLNASAAGTSPLMDIGFLCCGLALVIFKAGEAKIAVFAQALACVALAVSASVIVGHAYGAAALVGVGRYAAMSPLAAAAFFILASSLLAADAKHGFMGIATSDTSGGVVSRRLLSAIPLVLFALGWASLKAAEAGLFDFHLALAATVSIGGLACAAGIAVTAVTLHKTDLVRKEAMAQIRALNDRLDRQEEERKQQLAKSMAELGAANKMLEKLSQHDGLTGVANRAYFDKYLESQIAIARRHNRSVALVLCDVDSFKAYNDNYGHQAGDECLKQVAAAILSSSKRTADVVARYGGEEFAIILPETGVKGAMRVAESARAAVARMKLPHGHSLAGPHVSVSGGVAATVWQGEQTAKQLIAAADKLLYEGKRQGRNRMISAPAVAA